MTSGLSSAPSSLSLSSIFRRCSGATSPGGGLLSISSKSLEFAGSSSCCSGKVQELPAIFIICRADLALPLLDHVPEGTPLLHVQPLSNVHPRRTWSGQARRVPFPHEMPVQRLQVLLTGAGASSNSSRCVGFPANDPTSSDRLGMKTD